MLQDEMLDAVDENDNVLFSLNKKEFYERGLRSRIVNIAVIDPVTKKLALQIRGQGVSWQPLHYCLSAVGHVDLGEEWDIAARREMREELGVDAPVTLVHKQAFVDEFDYPYMIGIFTAEADHATLKAHPREVEKIIPMNRAEIESLLRSDAKLHNLLKIALEKVIDKIQ